MAETQARGIVTGPQPTGRARRFAARLRLQLAIRRAIRGFDLSDVLTIVAIALMAAGIVELFGPGWALLVVGIVIALMTPIGAAVRLFIRGR